MADAIDTLYEDHAIASGGVNLSLYRCTDGETLKPRFALSGFVEHRCPRCLEVVHMQSLIDYRACRAAARDFVVIPCPYTVSVHHGRCR